MNKKIILLLLAIVLIFGATSAVSAADISVSDVADDNSVTVDAVSVVDDAANIASVDATSDNDKNISDLSASAKEDDKEINSLGDTKEVTDGNFNTLKSTIEGASAGDIIKVSGTYKFNSQITIYKSITVMSENGAILNGNKNYRLFNITTSNVLIDGLTFINGYTNKGGTYGGAGGAILLKNEVHNVTIKNCNFENNVAKSTSFGGAILVGQKDYGIIIENCEFINNTADYGGAVRFDGSDNKADGPYNCIIKDCYFSDNSASTHGGAVCSFGRNITVINSTFKSNSAPYSGAFHSHGSGVTWIDCNFTGNKATGASTGENGYGGAVSLLDKTSYKNLGFNFTGCTFEDNNANNYGGAVEIKANYANISDCVFINNEARNTGAAININGNYTNITGVNMTGNKAVNGAGVYINGRYATVSDSNINNNTATTNGAGIYINGNYAKVDGVNMTGNKAVNGSGVYITGDNAIINNSNISSNNATNAGAAAWIKGDNTKILNSDIEENYADKRGGAIYIDGKNTVIDNSTFYSNEVNHVGKNANGLGGAFYVSGNDTTISHSVFGGNIACNGSAIYADGSINITNDTFLANQARIYKMPIENNGTHVNSTLEGGDNILNAIFYSGSLNDFWFTGNFTKNGTVVSNWTNKHPVEGVDNSNNGTIPYRDVHEEGQKVTLTIKNATSVVEELNCTTDLGGKVVYALSQDVIDSIGRGNWYIASLYHGEDDFYTEISNSTVIGSNSTLSLDNMTFMVGNASGLIHGALCDNVTKNMIPDALINLTVTYLNGTVIFNFTAITQDQIDGPDNPEGQFWVDVINQLNQLPVGLYKLNGVTVNGTGDKPVYGLAYINVLPAPTAVSAENITQSYPYENHTITVNVTDLINATKTVNEGYVEITLPNGTKINATVENGVATFKDIYSDRIGNFPLDVKYYGDEYYGNSTGKYIWNVSAIPAPSVTKSSNVSGKVKKDDLVEYNITVTNNANITVTYTVVDDLTNSGLLYNSTNTTANVTGQKVTWTITLAPNEVREIYLVTRVNASNTQLSNTVTIGNSTSNVTNSSDVNITVDKLANITVTKTANVSDIQYSGEIEWTITVKNNGPDAAEDVNVTEILDNKLEFVSCSATKGTYNDATGIWTIGDLPNGESVTLTIKTKVITNDGNITNNVTVTSPTPDVLPNGTVVPSVNKTNITNPIPVTPLSNPEVTKEAKPDVVIEGSEVKYTITIKNNNTVDLKYNITDIMDKGLVFNSTNNTEGFKPPVSTEDKVILTWTDFTIKAGETVVIEVIARVDASNTKLNNTVIVNNEDLDMNSSTATVVVGNLANITVTKELNDTSIEKVNRGDVVVWKIVVTNNGPDAAENVTGKEVFDRGLKFVSYEASSGTTYDSGTGKWNIGTLNKDANATLYITTRVTENSGTISNTITITSPTADIDEDGKIVPEVNKTVTNNSVPIDFLVDPVVDKVVEVKDKYVVNDIIAYNITVTNPNNISITYLVVDTLPNGLVFVEDGSTAGYVVDGQTVSWNVTVGANSNETITLMARITVPGTNLTNHVTAGNTTRNVTNGTDVNITVDNLANITVTKDLENPVEKVYRGDVVVWKIVVTNNGPNATENVTITDVIGSGLEYVNSTGGIYADGVVKWRFTSPLAAKANITLYVTTRVTSNNGTINNTVVVTSPTSDTLANGTVVNSTNKTNTTEPTDVGTLVDPKVSKTADPYNPETKYIKDGLVKYTITVNNPNEIDIVYLVVDTLVDGLVFVEDGSTAGYVVDGQTVSWNVTVGANSNETITLIANITKSNCNITNTVTVGNTTRDVGNSSDVNITVDNLANITVSKTTPTTSIQITDIINWTITVTNNGNDSASDVKVKEILGDGLVFDKVISVTKGDYDNATGIWTIGDLDSNEVVTLVIATKVTKNNGAVVNTVVVTSPTSDVDENGTVTPTVNKTNTTTPIPVVPLSNPKVTKVANQTKVIDNDTIKYVINITNDNTVDIDFVVNDTMDKGLVFISANTTGYINTTIGDKVIITWNNFTVKSGETRTIEVIVRVDASDIALNNTVNVYNQEYAMNTSHASIVVSKLVNITVSKTLNDTSIEKVNRGDEVVWKIVVRNNGPDDAENVTVTDVIGNGLTFVTATGDYTESDGIVTWFFNDLTKDGEIELYVTTRVISNEANIVNTLNVISPTPDLDENGTVVPTVNKTITNGSITVDALVDPTVTKTIDTQDKYVKGDIVKYTIVVTNPNNITIVYHVVDTLPKGLVFVEEGSTEGANVDGQTISWDVEVAPNSDASIILMALIDITNGELTNIVTVDNTTRIINASGNETITVEKLDVIITIPDVNGTAGEKVTVDISVIDERGNPVNNEKLTVTLPDGSVVTVPVVDGIARVEFILPAEGTYKIYAYLTGSDYYNDAEAEGNVVTVANETPEPTPVHGIPMEHTGSPLAILALILMVLSGCTYRFKKE